MKILALADLHGQIIDLGDLRGYDLIAIAGDITNFGDYEDAKKVLANIISTNIRLIAVPGNCDLDGVGRYLDEVGSNLDQHNIEIDGIQFVGLGGSNVTPDNTPNEYSDDKLMERLKIKIEMGKKLVLITHVPPYGSKLDRIFSGRHVGSKAVRRFIEEYKPLLVICGHIHEAKGEDFIDKSRIINPGPRRKVAVEI